MSASANVSAGDDILATQYNNLRTDVLNISTGHGHTGATDDGKKLTGSTAINQGTVRGSTANSSATEKEISQGTISTPDLRNNAVSNMQYSVPTTGSHAGTTDGASITITTIGNPVLIFVKIQFANNRVTAGDYGINWGITRDTTDIPGTAEGCFKYNELSSGGLTTVNSSFVDYQSAGTYTYKIRYSLTDSVIVNTSIIAIELRK